MKCSVTIVDDCEDFRFLISALLERKLDANCLTVASFTELQANATSVLKSQIVLLDINLGPGQPDGVTVCEWLQSQSYPGKIFFLTGHAKGSPHVARAASTGVPVLEKPLPPDEIVAILQAALPLQSARA